MRTRLPLALAAMLSIATSARALDSIGEQFGNQPVADGSLPAGLLPILWSTGTGSEVMQRIAVPMVGGMISSTVLTLIVIPAIYAQVKMRRVRVLRDTRQEPALHPAE